MTDQEHQTEHARQCAQAMNHSLNHYNAYRDLPPLRAVRPDYREKPRTALWRRVLRSPLLWECLCVFFLSAAITWGLGK